jgi:hypothetical protein
MYRGGIGVRCLRLTTLSPPCADRLEILQDLFSRKPKGLSRNVMGWIAFNTHIDTSTLPEVFDTALHIRSHIFPAVYLTCSGRPVITTLQKKKNVLSNILVMDQPLSQNFGQYLYKYMIRFIKSNCLFLQQRCNNRPNSEWRWIWKVTDKTLFFGTLTGSKMSSAH